MLNEQSVIGALPRRTSGCAYAEDPRTVLRWLTNDDAACWGGQVIEIAI